MNAQQLFFADGSPSMVWVCGACKTTQVSTEHHPQWGQTRAEACCRCGFCGKATTMFRHSCEPCEERARSEHEAKVFGMAQKITPAEHDGWVATKDGKFYASVEVLLDNTPPEEVPRYVYVCAAVRFAQLDPDSILSALNEESYEDFDGDFEGEDEFREACAAFNALNEHHVVYYEDTKRVIILREDAE